MELVKMTAEEQATQVTEWQAAKDVIN